MSVLKVPAERIGQRLDVWLASRYPDYSRAFLQKWVRSGRVTLAGQATDPSYRLKAGELFEIADFKLQISDKEAAKVAAVRPHSIITTPQSGTQEIVPVILFEDASLLVLNKPAGLVVHPAPSYRGATLIDWLRRHMGGKVLKYFTDPERLGLVHRLDKDTSGVLMVAKSVPAQVALARQFHDRTIRKTYLAWVEGSPSSATGVITAPVGRSRKDPTRMMVSGSGRASETSFEVMERMKEVSLLKLYPKTGRTHQIRVHVAAMGHPIVGDRTYGANVERAERFGVRRPLLHARSLELKHPASGKAVTFEAPVPPDFRAARTAFRRVLAGLAVVLALTGSSLAEEAAAAPAHHTQTKTSSGASASAVRAVKRDVASLKEQLEALQADLSGMKEQLAGIEAGLSQLDAARRMRDLERALPDMNAKLVTATNNSEEARSQALDASRKVHNQQDTLDQLRDLVDRLQRQLMQQKSQQESAAEAPPVLKSNSAVPSRNGGAGHP